MSEAQQAPRNTPYWQDDAEYGALSLALSPGDLPAKIETLVIGAGFSGLSAALTLARAGRQVCVVDAGGVGFGCSSRNGGQIGPSFHKLGLAGLTRAFGQPKAEAILRESMDSLTWLRSLIAKEGIMCDLQASGRFKGAASAREYENMARECEALERATGQRFEAVPQSSQQTRIGSNFYSGGIFYPDDGLLQPAKYVLGLAQRVVEAGATIHASLRVLGITREDNGFELHLSGGRTVSAREVLVATNGYSGPELPFFHRRILPLRSAIIATEPLDPGLVANCFPTQSAVVDNSRLMLYYRPSPDGRRVVFGGRAFDLADRPDHYAPDLRRLMLRIFPQLADAAISHAWSGTVGYTFDYAPHLGCHEGLHYVMGYCGSGVGRAGYFGHKIALQMLGNPEGRTEVDGLPFPTRRLYSGTPWFLPIVLRWQSLLDRIGR